MPAATAVEATVAEALEEDFAECRPVVLKEEAAEGCRTLDAALAQPAARMHHKAPFILECRL